ncbi:3-deoxy-D-manno-octulosonic acid transferase [Rhodovulum euryhalinum]|uniref:3-deoxy-D-manno-octulosonic acid transferase n=1 Tax=Rhodovulum euryhalinum TaxID=35805 RepID=A0A4R2KQS4_9RHOB|nr:glycosyltransferase N-terminal domain-containing protein [Rhodovulum euryhalinum]TCO73289.1 3-deoxy-D-manno-octulosonic-acid transferase [Rhodovulum euryhalinum]
MARDAAEQGARPQGPVVWLHAPPPLERAAAAELIRALHAERAGLGFLVTDTGAAPDWTGGLGRLPGLHLAAAPRETGRQVTDFLAAWQPTIAIFYPETLPMTVATQAHGRRTILFLIARELPESWRTRWRLGTNPTRRVLRRFDRVFAQSRACADQMKAMGVSQVQLSPCGPLSEGSAVLRCSEAEREALARLMGGRPAWLAACTRRAEEPVVVAAHSAAIRQAHRLLLLLAPDDPARGPALARRLRDEGWAVTLRSEDEEPETETQIYVADTEGELGLWLRLAPVTFVGGTFAADGGPDPYHAAALGSAIIHGPATGGHPAHYRQLAAAGAAQLARDEHELAEAVADLLSPDRAAELASAAWAVSTEGSTATERVVRRMLEALDLAEAG